jgi:GT2 family glycosyltransferase
MMSFPMQEPQAEQAPRRVSVIIVSFNDAGALRRCLTALEASADRDAFEILVVDNGSLDDCPRMDAEFPNINLLRLPRHFGMVKALNIGMRTARGEFFLFLEPAMEVTTGAIAALVAQLDAAPDAVAVCPLALGPEGEVVSRLHPLPLPAELQRAWLPGDLAGWTAPEPAACGPVEVDYFKPPAMMVRSYFLKGLRYIDERYSNSWWDLEICTQIGRAGRKILLVPAARVVLHPSGREWSLPSGVRGLLAADRALCAAVWCGKHYGWIHGFKFRLAALLRSLASLLTLREPGYRFAVFTCLLNGQKLDGSQRAP